MFPIFCFPVKKEKPLTPEEKVRFDETVNQLRDGATSGKSLSWAIEQLKNNPIRK